MALNDEKVSGSDRREAQRELLTALLLVFAHALLDVALALRHLATAFTFHPLRLAHLGQGALFALSA